MIGLRLIAAVKRVAPVALGAALLLSALLWGFAGALGALAGAAIVWGDLVAIAWLVSKAHRGTVSRRALVLVLLPLKLLLVGVLVYFVVIVLALHIVGFLIGVTAGVGATLAGALLVAGDDRAGREKR